MSVFKGLICCTRRPGQQDSLPVAPSGFSWDTHYSLDNGFETKASSEIQKSKDAQGESAWEEDSTGLDAGHEDDECSSEDDCSSSASSYASHLHDDIASVLSSRNSSFDIARAEKEADEEADKENEVPDKDQLLQDMLSVARKVKGPFQKCPKSDLGFFKSTQERYVAAIPKEREAVPSGDRLKHEIACWEAGTLACWESCADYVAQETPICSIPLLQIAEVHATEDMQDGHGAVIKHMQGEEMSELVLFFPNKIFAVKWVYSLSDLLSKLCRLRRLV